MGLVGAALFFSDYWDPSHCFELAIYFFPDMNIVLCDT